MSKKQKAKQVYLMIREIPEDIKIRFKTMCAKNNVSMRDTIINFMKGALK